MDRFFSVLFHSSIQALLSTSLSLFFGLVLAFGLTAIENKSSRKLMEAFFMLPSFVPSLFLLISVIGLTQLIGSFPYNLIGVVFLHTIVNAGFLAVLLSRSLDQIVQPLLPALKNLGAPWTLSLRKIILPGLLPSLLRFGSLTFIFCFTSFSIPVTIGGASGATLDVLIYEAISGPGSTNAAVLMALFQMGFLFFGLSFIDQVSEQNLKSELDHRTKFGWQGFLVLGVSFSFLSLSGLFRLAFKDWNKVLNLFHETHLHSLAMNSLLFAAGVYALTSLGLITFTSLKIRDQQSTSKGLSRLLSKLTAPPTAILGGSFLLIFGQISSPIWQFFQLTLGLTLLFTPFLVRLFDQQIQGQLLAQIELASQMGASVFLIYQKIVWPQVRSSILLYSGISAFWAIGDFSLSLILFSKSPHLASEAHSMLSFYQLESASVLALVILVLGLLFFCPYGFINRFERRKPCPS